MLDALSVGGVENAGMENMEWKTWHQMTRVENVGVELENKGVECALAGELRDKCT